LHDDYIFSSTTISIRSQLYYLGHYISCLLYCVLGRLFCCDDSICWCNMLQISALERGRKVEELQKRLVESEMLRTRYNRKVGLLKDQVS
jgi:hypothetical protein